MMPKAKIVKRRKLPPLNRSKIPSAVPCAAEKIWSSTAPLIPGVGMWAPMRYTASSANVNRTRFRNSSMRNRFASACKKRFMRYPVKLHHFNSGFVSTNPATRKKNLERAAGLGNFLLGGAAESVRVNNEFVLQLAITQDFHLLPGAHKTVRAQQVRSDRF